MGSTLVQVMSVQPDGRFHDFHVWVFAGYDSDCWFQGLFFESAS